MNADTERGDRDELIDSLAAQFADAPTMIADVSEAIRRAAHMIQARRELAALPDGVEP